MLKTSIFGLTKQILHLEITKDTLKAIKLKYFVSGECYVLKKKKSYCFLLDNYIVVNLNY